MVLSHFIIKRIIIVINVLAAILLLIAGYSYLLNPASWWLLAMAGLIFPVIYFGNFLLMCVTILINKKAALITLVALLITIPTFLKCFSFGSNEAFNQAKPTNQLRVVSWNVGLMNLNARDTQVAIKQNLEILNALKETDADVICLQEFLTSLVPNGHYNFLDSIKRTQNYPYHFYAVDYDVYEGFFVSGTLILSRFPLLEKDKMAFKGPFRGSLVSADILFEGKKINLLSSRLQSLNFKRDEYAIFSNLKKGKADAWKGSGTMMRKIKYAYSQRFHQVSMIKEMEKKEIAQIFTGDLNDVPGSYAYAQIKGDMNDAWLDKGFGIGRTFSRISPTLRIDYIFYNKHLIATQTKRIITKKGSDHYGLVTDFKLR